MRFKGLTQIKYLFLTLLMVFTIASTALHRSHRHDSHHNSVGCSICLLDQAFSSPLSGEVTLLPQPVVTIITHLFWASLVITTKIITGTIARAPPLIRCC